MAVQFTTTADKRSSSAGGDVAPYTTEEAYNQLIDKDADQDTELTAIKNGSVATTWHTGLTDALDDAAAATAGVAIGGLYRSGSAIKVRVA